MSSKHDMMRHALGVQRYPTRWSKPYRNHFVAGDVDAWQELVPAGLATHTREPSDLTGGCPVFSVTDAGREAALAGITFKRRYGYGTPRNP